MSNHPAKMAVPDNQRLDFLDAIRALAAGLVFVEHTLDQVLPSYRSWTINHFFPGRIGVLVFLVVSGFIIPVSLEKCGSNLRFWIRRFFRLFPLYWLVILTAFLLSLAGWWSPYEPRVWLLNLTMLQSFFQCPNVVGLFWTLQLELIIYVACSILFAFRLLNRPDFIAGLILGAFIILGITRPLLNHQPFDVGGQRWLYFAPLVGLVAQRYLSGNLTRNHLLAVLFGHFVAVGIVWVVNNQMFPGAINIRTLQETAWTWGLTYTGFFGLMTLRNRRIPSVACWLGRISYSIYLLHPIAIALVILSEFKNWPLMAVSLVITLIFSDLTYRFVEKPGINLGKRIEKLCLPTPEIVQKPHQVPGKAA